MKTEDIEYRDGALTCKGYLVYDDKVQGKRPGILVVHEAWGLGKHAMERARMLAEIGYVALAADMYGGRRQLGKVEEMMEVLGDLRGNPLKLRARASAALEALKAQPQVDPSKIGAIGFCFGGSTVLELARGCYPVNAVVSFHGALEAVAPAEKGVVKSKVLVCTGADDPMVTPEHVVAFEDEMRKAGADWQVIAYGNTVHSFTNPEAGPNSPMPGLAYNATTDKRSWAAMRAHFDEAFA